MHVRSINDLPSYFNNSLISVHWKRTTDPLSSSLSTKFARVFNRTANFDETLSCVCSVTGTHNSSKGVAKYESKQFVISVNDNQDLDLGKNLIDLTRLLPLSLDELDDEEKRVGKWSTSFRLSGKAKGASLNVSFGFCVISGDEKSRNEKRVGRTGSFTRSRDRSRSVDDVKVLHEVLVSSSKSDASDLNDVNFDYDKNNIKECGETEFSVVEKGVEMDEKGGIETKVKGKEIRIQELRRIEFELDHIFKKKGLKRTEFEIADDVKKQELENIEPKAEKVIEESVLEKMEFVVRDEEAVAVKVKDEKAEKQFSEKTECELENQLKELELELEKIGNEHEEGVEVGAYDLGEELDLQEVMYEYGHVYDDLNRRFSSSAISGMHVEPKTSNQMIHDELKSRVTSKSNSLSLDDDDDTVASEFLNMLGIDHSPVLLNLDSDPESPRGRQWKQFAKETMPSSTSQSIFDIGKQPELVEGDYFAEDFDLSTIVQEAEMELQKAKEIKSRAKVIEDAESEALMRQWGLDEDAFHQSPPGSKSGFGSPIDLPPEEPVELPPLAEGLGSFIQTSDGGFLRSMSPTLFVNAKNNGNLIMQVSRPVVVPAEMGSGIMDILEKLASVGIEKLSLQAKKLMPLEEITGRTMEQLAWEVAPALESCERHEHSQDSKSGKERLVNNQISTKKAKNKSSTSVSEFVSLEDLAPSAMDKIESLSIEGLRIQSGMSYTEAPSNISPKSIENISTLEGKGTMESTGGLQLLNVKDSSDDLDGLMGLSITLDEWMQLDSGIINEDNDDGIISDRTSKVLAAHHARSSEMVVKGKHNKGKSKKWGILGNNFTVALMVQLRDPLRNYEPVGTPMLSLIQVERVFVPPKPKIYKFSEKGNSVTYDDDDEGTELLNKGVVEEIKNEEEVVPQFKVTEVHVAGIKNEPGKKKPWGNPTQQKSGSRWLLATGMGKSNKHPFMKAKPISKQPPSSSEMNSSTTAQPGDTLWSISSRILGDGGKWKELLALNPHIRNPNVIFPNEKIRLR